MYIVVAGRKCAKFENKNWRKIKGEGRKKRRIKKVMERERKQNIVKLC